MAKGHKKHKSSEEIISEIRKKFLNKISELSSQISKNGLDKSAIAFYEIFREFFSKFFRINHSFTYEELAKEIEHKRIDQRYKNRVKKLTEKLVHLEYSNVEMTNQHLKELVTELRYLIKKLTKVKKKKSKTEKKLDTLLKDLKKKTKIFKKLKLKRVTKPNEQIKEINRLLKKSRNAINAKELNRAKELYKEIFKIYRRLSIKDQDKVYKKITQVYKKKEPIYDLLNKAYDALIHHRKDEAKQYYIKIIKLYNNLPTEEKNKMHDEILKVFQSKKKPDINELIDKAYYYLGIRDIENTGQMYNKLDEIYRGLSEKEKEKIYPKLSSLYEDIKVIFS